MADWTRDRVEGRLIEAADVLRRLPEERLRGFVSSWPTMFHRFADLVGQAPPTQKPAAPAPDAITRMEATLPWLTWLQPDEAKLVWARAEGTPWKAICRRFGITRATAHRRWEYGLSVITWRLNGQRHDQSQDGALIRGLHAAFRVHSSPIPVVEGIQQQSL